LTNVFSLFTIN